MHGVFDESFGLKRTKSIGAEVIQLYIDRTTSTEPRKHVCCANIHVHVSVVGWSGSIVGLGHEPWLRTSVHVANDTRSIQEDTVSSKSSHGVGSLEWCHVRCNSKGRCSCSSRNRKGAVMEFNRIG